MTAPQPPTEPNATTETASSSAPHSGANEWRAGAHADPRLAGKSAEEILGIASALLTVAEKFNQPVPAQPPAPPPVNRFDLDLPDDDYIQGRQVKQLLQQVANQPPPVDHAARQLAAQAVYSNLMQMEADTFKRWRGEIEAEARKLPVEYWTLDNLKTIVEIVKSRHVSEIAAEMAQRLRDESHPTIRSGTGGSGGVPNTQASLLETGPSDMLARLRAVGIQSEAELRQACQGTGIQPEQYLAELEKYGKGAVIRG